VRQAGISGISAQGLRKVFAAKEAEAESTTKEIMALGGWKTITMVQKYAVSSERVTPNKNVQARRRNTKTEQN
jgi:hypothetical protein